MTQFALHSENKNEILTNYPDGDNPKVFLQMAKVMYVKLGSRLEACKPNISEEASVFVMMRQNTSQSK